MKQRKPSKRFYYENLLASQNITAKNNIVWVSDITTIDLPAEYFSIEKPKLNIFLCLDIHTNFVISYLVSIRKIDARSIIRTLSNAMEERLKLKPETLLIIHTDRGTQFTSQKYREFTESYLNYFQPSMSRQNTPTDNAVAERFMRTFKEHKIEGMTLKEALDLHIRKDANFCRYRSLVKRYVDSLNQKPNKKTKKSTPERKDIDVDTASLLMIKPIYPRAFSEYFGKDFRIDEIEKYKEENWQVTQLLNEIAAKRAEVVSETPFDYEDSILVKKLDQSMVEIRSLLLKNPELTKEYLESAIEPLQYTLEMLDKKIDKLMPKPKKIRETQKLRDPVTSDLFPIFLANAGASFTYKWDLRNAQLRIGYTILFHLGTRINEIRKITYQDIKDALRTSQFHLTNFQTRRPYVHVLSQRAQRDLESLEIDYEIVFKKYQYKYLFGKEKPVAEKTLIRMVNQDLKKICEMSRLPYNIKSHSFRVNVISSLLRITTLQNVAEIIGHEDIRSTMKYRRYSLSKAQIQTLMQEISNSKSENLYII